MQEVVIPLYRDCRDPPRERSSLSEKSVSTWEDTSDVFCPQADHVTRLPAFGKGDMALTDEAIEKIRAMITSGELRPGDRLPSEPELGAQLGLSRSSLREAVKALSLINVLDVRRGDGTYVT